MKAVFHFGSVLSLCAPLETFVVNNQWMFKAHLPDAAAVCERVAGCAVSGLGVRNTSEHKSIIVKDTRLTDDVNDCVDHRPASRPLNQRQVHRATDRHQHAQ